MLACKGLNDNSFQLGNYDKIKEIGKGGQGNVYLIREQSTGKQYAAKYLINSSEGSKN